MSKLLSTFLALTIASQMLSAQVATAELSGTVLDTAGAALPGAKVTVTNTGTNQSKETLTGATGNYIVPLLQPGDYIVTVEANGFKKVVQKGLSLQINQ
jgi:hypothetical protein